MSFSAMYRPCVLIAVILFPCLIAFSMSHEHTATGKTARNILIFLADGLRHGSVNPSDTPTLWRIRQQGVHFENSHSLFPTFTTANASAIATGHYLDDTGDFSNAIWTRYSLFTRGNFARVDGHTVTPFLEEDQVLGDLNDRYGGSESQTLTVKLNYIRNHEREVAPRKISDAQVSRVPWRRKRCRLPARRCSGYESRRC
jgi:Type I phosphodiesterase / nucleotide pyrophosphatase